MQTDIKAVELKATGAATSARARVRGLTITATSTAGSVVLKDVNGSGPTLFSITTPAAAGLHDIIFPGQGIRFDTAVHATLTSVDAITVLYTG